MVLHIERGSVHRTLHPLCVGLCSRRRRRRRYERCGVDNDEMYGVDRDLTGGVPDGGPWNGDLEGPDAALGESPSPRLRREVRVHRLRVTHTTSAMFSLQRENEAIREREKKGEYGQVEREIREDDGALREV